MREKIVGKSLIVKHVLATMQLVDILTKPLGTTTFINIRGKLRVASPPELDRGILEKTLVHNIEVSNKASVHSTIDSNKAPCTTTRSKQDQVHCTIAKVEASTASVTGSSRSFQSLLC